MTNCGHNCCAEFNDPFHDHFLHPADCPNCRAIMSSRCVKTPGGSQCVKPLHHDGPCVPEGNRDDDA